MEAWRGRIRGYRTLIVAGVLVIYAALSWAGIDVPSPDGEQSLAVSGALMALLRVITSGPIGGSK